MIIIGAGYSGLIAAHFFPKAKVLEIGAENNHKALLRFRSPDVGNALNIPFKKVNVSKGVYFDGKFVSVDVRLANWYSKKVVGRISDRSVWNIEPSQRYIAPENLYEQMLDAVGKNVSFNTAYQHWAKPTEEISISTLPMHAMCAMVDMPCPTLHRAPIIVRRWRLPEDCNVYQTVYFPDPTLKLYRASITGNLLIAEYSDTAGDFDGTQFVFDAFGLFETDAEPLGEYSQSYGKIAPTDELWRRKIVADLTTQHNVYSLGRFATWRNILLDDVLKDIQVIKSLIEMDEYGRRKIS